MSRLFHTKPGKLIRTGTLILVLLTLASCSVLPAARQEAILQAQTERTFVPVTRGNIAGKISFIGNLQYNQSATQVWKTSGVIDKVYVEVGDSVKKGDILAELETGSMTSSAILAEKNYIDQQENLENVRESTSASMQAYLTLSQKESALKTAKLEQEALYYPRATQEEMERAWDALALASLNFNYAKQDYDHLVEIGEPFEGYEPSRTVRFFGRTFTIGGNSKSGRERKFDDYVSTYNTLVSAYETYLWTTGEPTATDYAIAEGNVQVAQMEYDKALEEYLSYENMPRVKDVSLAEAGLRTAETAYNARFIIAPFDGTVTSLTALEGYYVTQGSTALRVDDMERIFVPISIPELDFNEVQNGAEVAIIVDAIPGKTYHGHIFSISDASQAEGNATVFSAMVEVEDPDNAMLAGMTAEISLPSHEKTGVLLVPNSAITYENGVPMVTVVNGDVWESVEVRLGIVTDSVSEVMESGLVREGAQLAVENVSDAALNVLGLDASSLNTGTSGRRGIITRPTSTPPAPVPRPTGTVVSEPVEGVPMYRRDPDTPVDESRRIPVTDAEITPETTGTTLYRRDPELPAEASPSVLPTEVAPESEDSRPPMGEGFDPRQGGPGGRPDFLGGEPPAGFGGPRPDFSDDNPRPGRPSATPVPDEGIPAEKG